MAKTVKLALAVEGTEFTKRGQVNKNKSPLKKGQEQAFQQQAHYLGKRNKQEMLKKFVDQDEYSESESDEGPRSKRPKRTLQDTPQKQQPEKDDEEESHSQKEPMEIKSGSEEEYVPGQNINLP